MRSSHLSAYPTSRHRTLDVRLPRRIIARPAPDLSVRFRFRNPSVTHLKTRLTLGTPLPCSLGGEHADIQVDVKDKWTAEVMVKAPDRPGLLNDVCAALNDNNLHVVGAEITTVEERDPTSLWSGSQRSAR